MTGEDGKLIFEDRSIVEAMRECYGSKFREGSSKDIEFTGELKELFNTLVMPYEEEEYTGNFDGIELPPGIYLKKDLRSGKMVQMNINPFDGE